MAELYDNEPFEKKYWDKQTYASLDAQLLALSKSATLYVGNLSFYTSEAQLYQLFSAVGKVKRVVMGLDRIKKTPCGFCFVEYFSHEQAMACKYYISGTKLDNRIIRCEMDGGFKDGRQYGRGNSGGQVRDERRSKDDYDAGRGGYGKGNNLLEQQPRNMPFRRNAFRKRSRDDSFSSDKDSKMRKESNDEGGNASAEDEVNPRFRDRDHDDAHAHSDSD